MGTLKSIGTILVWWFVIGGLAVGVGNISREVQYIRAYPDAVDRDARTKGQPSGNTPKEAPLNF